MSFLKAFYKLNKYQCKKDRMFLKVHDLMFLTIQSMIKSHHLTYHIKEICILWMESLKNLLSKIKILEFLV